MCRKNWGIGYEGQKERCVVGTDSFMLSWEMIPGSDYHGGIAGEVHVAV